MTDNLRSAREETTSHVCGDALQFDPGRKTEPYAWDDVLVEHCFLWTGPLDRDYAEFKRGERPGESAFDSKVAPAGPRARITIRSTLMQGWGHMLPGLYHVVGLTGETSFVLRTTTSFAAMKNVGRHDSNKATNQSRGSKHE